MVVLLHTIAAQPWPQAAPLIVEPEGPIREHDKLRCEFSLKFLLRF